MACITEAKVIDFVWKVIIYRFEIFRVLIINNGLQFVGTKFEEFCEDYGISHHFTSVAHLQANGEVEVTNQTLQGIKKRLGQVKGLWTDELHHVLWIYWTTPRVPIEEILELSFRN